MCCDLFDTLVVGLNRSEDEAFQVTRQCNERWVTITRSGAERSVGARRLYLGLGGMSRFLECRAREAAGSTKQGL